MQRLLVMASGLLLVGLGQVGCGGTPTTEIQSTSQAVIGVNGLSFNGLKFNGIKYNGIKYNGIKYNGPLTSSTTVDVTGVTISKYGLKGKITKPDGSLWTLYHRDFVGVTLPALLEDGQTVSVKIVEWYAKDSRSEGYYTLDVGGVNPCGAGVRAIAADGIWQANGSKVVDPTKFSLACTSASVGKCVTMGYHPSVSPDMHMACVRMLRADYCGDGVAHTQDGNVINAADTYSWQLDDHLSYPQYTWAFDASWKATGAVCRSGILRPGAAPVSCSLPPCHATTMTNGNMFYINEGILKNWAALN